LELIDYTAENLSPPSQTVANSNVESSKSLNAVPEKTHSDSNSKEKIGLNNSNSLVKQTGDKDNGQVASKLTYYERKKQRLAAEAAAAMAAKNKKGSVQGNTKDKSNGGKSRKNQNVSDEEDNEGSSEEEEEEEEEEGDEDEEGTPIKWFPNIAASIYFCCFHVLRYKDEDAEDGSDVDEVDSDESSSEDEEEIVFKSSFCSWEVDEDKLLLLGVAACGMGRWREIREHFGLLRNSAQMVRTEISEDAFILSTLFYFIVTFIQMLSMSQNQRFTRLAKRRVLADSGKVDKSDSQVDLAKLRDASLDLRAILPSGTLR
jgi:hypothetical protein